MADLRHHWHPAAATAATVEWTRFRSSIESAQNSPITPPQKIPSTSNAEM